ncbi:MAG: hypothetical protein AAGA47_04720 [Pseudomonadota bacterium]
MRLLMVSAALVSVATGAYAQNLSYANGELSFTSLDGDGDTTDVTYFEGSAGFDVGAVDLFGDVIFTEFDLSGDDVDLSTVSLGAGYSFGGWYRTDVSYTQFENDAFGFGDSTDVTEVGLGFNDGLFLVRGAYAALEEDSGADALYGLTLGLQFNENTDASVSRHRLEAEDGGEDENLSIASLNHNGDIFELEIDMVTADDVFSVGLNGNYAITSRFGVLGSLAQVSIDDDDVLDRIGAGGFYQIADGLRIDAEIFRIDSDGDDVDGITVGLRYDMGAKSVERETQIDRLNSAVNRSFGLNF